MDIDQVNSFFEVLLFFFIEPLDNLYLFGGQVVEFVDELVDFFLFDCGVFTTLFFGNNSVNKFIKRFLIFDGQFWDEDISEEINTLTPS